MTADVDKSAIGTLSLPQGLRKSCSVAVTLGLPLGLPLALPPLGLPLASLAALAVEEDLDAVFEMAAL